MPDLRGAPIAFMDSGIGGLPYLSRARELLPGESFIYLADTDGFPYGEKDALLIRKIVIDRVARIMDQFAPKALVIACNTASQTALHAVRQAWPGFPVIGTVPAVKPAAESSRTRTIGVLATERTVRDPYLDLLIERHARGCTVLRCGAGSLVEFVERGYAASSGAERRAVIAPFVDGLVRGGADRIVLACTHFLHVAGEIGEIARDRDPSVEAVDSREGVAKRLVQVLRERGLRTESVSVQRKGIFLVSGSAAMVDREGMYGGWALRFGLYGPCLLRPRS
ncbi:MAG: glutamate racemase [Rectinemataceae bacterium]|nr:glutamate racemase [Rectinemataceae bacterium]